MARPSKYGTGAVITVLIDGKAASWCDGILTGDPAIVEATQFAIDARSEYRLGFVEVTAGDQSLLEVAAALAAMSPGRARFTELPAEVAAVLAGGHADPAVFDTDQWIKGEA
jgi:hypothetical protein